MTGHLFQIRRLGVAFAASCLATLSACGGGVGDDDGATPSGGPTVDRYVGTWVTPCEVGINGKSGQVQLTITPAGTNKVKTVLVSVLYANTACTGPSEVIPNSSTEAVNTFVGTKTASSKLVDKVMLKESGYTFNFIVFTDGTNFIMSSEDCPLDSDGYPNTLSSDRYFNYQRK